MKLNCDLGESFGAWQKGQDSEIMPLIDQANIACGFHAADPLIMQKTVRLAAKHQVSIGAHPSYPDLVGFGRRSMTIASDELQALIVYQIGALQAFCRQENVPLDYVKPHGALYNDMMKDLAIFSDVCAAIAAVDPSLMLMMQALPDTSAYKSIADSFKLPLLYEAFADRNYQSNGLLIPRTAEHAVIENEQWVIDRCKRLLHDGTLLDINGQPLNMQVDSLCMHGDNSQALVLVKAIRLLFSQQ